MSGGRASQPRPACIATSIGIALCLIMPVRSSRFLGKAVPIQSPEGETHALLSSVPFFRRNNEGERWYYQMSALKCQLSGVSCQLSATLTASRLRLRPRCSSGGRFRLLAVS
jgi:hypothetical protein